MASRPGAKLKCKIPNQTSFSPLHFLMLPSDWKGRDQWFTCNLLCFMHASTAFKRLRLEQRFLFYQPCSTESSSRGISNPTLFLLFCWTLIRFQTIIDFSNLSAWGWPANSHLQVPRCSTHPLIFFIFFSVVLNVFWHPHPRFPAKTEEQKTG